MNAFSKNGQSDGLNGHVQRGYNGNGHIQPVGVMPLGLAVGSSLRARSEVPPSEKQHAPAEPNNRTPTLDDASVGRRIREQRRVACRTQKDIAKSIGVTGAQFHRYEMGLTRVATSRLMAIAAALNIRPDVLMGVAIVVPVEVPFVPTSSSGTDDLLELVEVFASITDPRRRHALLVLARVIAKEAKAPTAELAGD